MLKFEKRDQIKKLIEKYTKYAKLISFLRLFLAFITILWVICLISIGDYVLYGILAGVTFVALIVFVLFTNKYFYKLSLLKNQDRVYENHIRKRNLELNHISDNGIEFIKGDDYKLTDLDVFGNKSLYQYLTSARTKLGREALARQLSNPVDYDDDFKNAIYELGNSENTIEVEASLLQFTDEYKKLSYSEALSIIGNKIKFSPLFILPVISFAMMCAYIVLVFTVGLNPYTLFVFPVINYLLIRVCLKNDIFAVDSSKYSRMLENYIFVIEAFENVDYKESYLIKMKNDMKNYKASLNSMKKIFGVLSSRKNAIVNILLNSLVIYDFFILIIYNKMNKGKNNIEELFKLVGRLEMMLSLANVAIDNEIYCKPMTSKEFKAEGLYHPLVKNCVSNDFSFDGGIVLTGSNMSGKTTFMRTIGINQLLFNAGGLVFASRYEGEKLPIFTSLRANDMLQEGISTFYAEILRMKKMNEAIQNGKCLILVDEIFKGTNAYERIEGSKIVIQKFVEKKVLFIVSTHDFELCDCANILNYHFNEDYQDDKISFDYKIKSGKCESSNALYLLKLSNII